MRVLTKGAVLSGALSLWLSCATAHAGSWDLAGVNIYTSTDYWNSQGQEDTGPCYSASIDGESLTTSAHDSITSTGPYATASTDIETSDWGGIEKEWKWSSDGSYDYPEPAHLIVTASHTSTVTSSATGDSSAWAGKGEEGDDWEINGTSDITSPEYRYFGTCDEDGQYVPDERDGFYAGVYGVGVGATSVLHLSGNNGTAEAAVDQSCTWSLDLGSGFLDNHDPE